MKPGYYKVMTSKKLRWLGKHTVVYFIENNDVSVMGDESIYKKEDFSRYEFLFGKE